jgi:hypothetical protein
VNEALHERVRRIRERALIRSWEYRQRNHAKGVWYRFRRVLVDAAEAWIVDDRDADRLESDGCTPLPVGRELAPPKRMLFATPRQLAELPSRRKVPVRLGRELLEAPNLVLVPHE